MRVHLPPQCTNTSLPEGRNRAPLSTDSRRAVRSNASRSPHRGCRKATNRTRSAPMTSDELLRHGMARPGTACRCGRSGKVVEPVREEQACRFAPRCAHGTRCWETRKTASARSRTAGLGRIHRSAPPRRCCISLTAIELQEALRAQTRSSHDGAEHPEREHGAIGNVEGAGVDEHVGLARPQRDLVAALARLAPARPSVHVTSDPYDLCADPRRAGRRARSRR